MAMPEQRPLDRAELDVDDPAFAPRSSFDFAEEASGLGNNASAINAFHGQDLDFDLMADLDAGGNDFAADFFQGQMSDFDFGATRPMGTFSKANLSLSNFPTALDPPSMQNSIVSSRHGQVNQHFGQITPPDEMVPQPFKAPQAKQTQMLQSRALSSGKLSNEQRARNAANTRHSRPKSATTKKSTEEREGSEDEEALKQKNNINLQREKNRVAAAKCRAKKKTSNEQREEMANEFSNTHSQLTKEIRELKNQKTELKNYLLAHRPGVCECHGIHDYNLGQAHKLVLNARRHAVGPAAPSPSQESVFSGRSSGSDATGMMFPAPSPLVSPSAMSLQSPAQSFNTPIDLGFGPMTDPQSMQNGLEAMDEGRCVPGEFADFLQSSTGGRAGLS